MRELLAALQLVTIQAQSRLDDRSTPMGQRWTYRMVVHYARHLALMLQKAGPWSTLLTDDPDTIATAIALLVSAQGEGS